MGINASSVCDIRKGEYLAKQGGSLPGVAFLISGMFRFFYIDNKGREHTDCFCGQPGSPVIPAIDLNDLLPINIQALEDSRVVIISAELINKLLEDNIEVIRLYNRMLISSLTQHWEDKMALHQYDAEHRYEWFLERYKGLIDRVPHIHLRPFWASVQ